MHAPQRQDDWDQLEHIHHQSLASRDVSAGVLHPHLNRYTDVFPDEHSRVHVRTPYLHSDYINANHITPHLILGQAPTPACFEAFYHMLIQQSVQLIVMLTDTESGKAEPYWPIDPMGTLDVGPFSVSIDKIQPSVRVLCIRNRHTGIVLHRVTHIQFLTWPDHSVPDPISGVKPLRNILDQMLESSQTFIHCSAGLGRSGALAAAYLIRSGQCANRFEAVQYLRKQRSGCVQNRGQYDFIPILTKTIEGSL